MLTLPSIWPAGIDTHQIAPSRASAPAQARKSGPTILLVDDDSSVRSSICRALTAEGLRVVPARGVKDALDCLNLMTPDLVITDLCMTLLSGWDLIAYLGDHYPALPIIVISALSEKSAGGVGRVAAAFLQKPLGPETLLAAIQHELDWPRSSERISGARS